ncbi:FABP family protein [Saccharopolyspora erythraea]|uniref:FABP family protein n=1 Tax=Saccharopolyspora erythraea TaxID=1836 RepID=UPI001BA6DBFD|nr:FABP family protein [Saccharopolyspora erythraea]QUH05432.1 FABP family protein [Saccharopolyspora erythraea]
MTSSDQPERGSGDAAVQAAAERAEQTRGRNVPQFDDLPGVGDTANLRLGAELNQACLALLPLVGVWRGDGEAKHPALPESYWFRQQVTFAHDGRPFVFYESRAWRLDREGGEVVAPDFREVGWLRPQADDTIEFLLVHAGGVSEMFFGKPRNQTTWEFATDAVIRTPSAEDATAASRLYGVVEGALAYVEERATSEHELQPRLSAKLDRVVG